MSVPHVISSSLLSVCHKLSNLLEVRRSSDKNKLGHFLAHFVHALTRALLCTVINGLYSSFRAVVVFCDQGHNLSFNMLLKRIEIKMIDSFFTTGKFT